MSQTHDIFDALKRSLKARGMTYHELAQHLFLSEASVKRLFAQENLSLARLEAICTAIDISISDLIRMTPTHASSAYSRLSVLQEQTLAASPRLLTFFYLLNNDWPLDRIAAEYGIQGKQADGFIARLKAVDLAGEDAKGRIRSITAQRIDWRTDGPVMQLYEAQAKAEFLKSDFAGQNDAFRAMTGELSAASIQILKRKLAQLTLEFDELTQMDRPLPGDAKHSVGLLTAIRPWTFSVVSQLRVRPTHRH